VFDSDGLFKFNTLSDADDFKRMMLEVPEEIRDWSTLAKRFLKIPVFVLLTDCFISTSEVTEGTSSPRREKIFIVWPCCEY
jgi:hypothetical protein